MELPVVRYPFSHYGNPGGLAPAPGNANISKVRDSTVNLDPVSFLRISGWSRVLCILSCICSAFRSFLLQNRLSDLIDVEFAISLR